MSSSHLSVPRSLTGKLIGLAAVGGAVLVASVLFSPDRVWANLLLASYYLITVGLGGAVFIALTTVCGAGWSVAIRRVPEAMVGLLPVASVAVLAVLATRISDYAWHHHGHGDAGTFWFKELWLEPKFFAARAVGFVVLWTVFSQILIGRSRRLDNSPGGSKAGVSRPVAVVFLVMFATTISLAGADWIMALEPMWFSTMWGVYQFSGLIMATLAVMIVACVLLRRHAAMHDVIRVDHLHDLAKLLIGFSCFWMYIWFSQYMLIWYSNIPEETSYFVRRTHGPWGPVMIGNIVLNWVIPFFVLLPRPCKRSEHVLLRIACVVLIGRWVDLYVMIFPPLTGDMPVFGVPEVATAALLCGLAPLLFLRSFASRNPVPRNDPYLAESLHYHA